MNGRLSYPFREIVDKAVNSVFRAAGINDSVKLHKNPPIVVQASHDAPMRSELSKDEDVLDLDLAVNTLIELGEDESPRSGNV